MEEECKTCDYFISQYDNSCTEEQCKVYKKVSNHNKGLRQFEVEIYPEICCEVCMDIIHNHFECPVCKDTYANTSIYGYIQDHGNNFTCEECNSEFKIILLNDFPDIIIEKI